MPLVLAIVLGACADSATVPDPAPRRTPIVTVDIQPGPVPLTRRVEVTLDGAAGLRIDYWTEGAERLRRTITSPAESHGVLLSRLRPDTRYNIELRALGGEDQPAVGTFVTPPLPQGLAGLEFSATGTPTHDLTAVEITRGGGQFEGVVIVDAAGEVVWYFNAPLFTGIVRRSNGNFVFLSWTRGLMEVSPAGEVVNQVEQGPADGRWMHHDVITTPWNTVLVLANETREIDGQDIAGEAIWEWEPEAGRITQRWSAFDFLVPAENWGPASIPSDWLHANSISLGPDGNILMSLRFLDQVLSITPDFQEIEWRLGGINGDIAATGDAAFIGQHTASELPAVNGRRRVLLFDNGSSERGYSRALELEIDPPGGTSRTVWEFRPTPDNFAFITSLARRLGNGNTFVAFGPAAGVVGSSGPVEAFEVQPDGSIQYHLELEGEPLAGPAPSDIFVMYRASPLDAIGEEEVVSP